MQRCQKQVTLTKARELDADPIKAPNCIEWRWRCARQILSDWKLSMLSKLLQQKKVKGQEGVGLLSRMQLKVSLQESVPAERKEEEEEEGKISVYLYTTE